jgi:hypothetical protein
MAACAAGGLGCAGDPGPAGSKGDPGAKGDPGDPGTPGPASVSAVTPVSAFLARTIDVTISGNGTSWSDKTTADFGPKIKVNSITAASATALVANISVEAGATLGPRDVKVSIDGADLVYKGAFEVKSPLKLGIEGTTAQGSVYYVHARGLDFTTPFDTTSTGDGFFTPLVYSNISVSQAPGVYGDVSSVADYTADFRFVTDVDTTPGPQDFSIQSGPAKDFVDFPSPAAYSVAARKPTVIVPGTNAPFQVDTPAQSSLFTYAPADVSTRIVDVTLTATDADAFPAAYFLPKSGKFNDLFAAGSAKTFATTSSDPVYLIALDGSPSYSGYTGKISIAETKATSSGEKEPNDSKNLAIGNGPVVPPLRGHRRRAVRRVRRRLVRGHGRRRRRGQVDPRADHRARPAHRHGGRHLRDPGQLAGVHRPRRQAQRRQQLPRRADQHAHLRGGHLLRQGHRLDLPRHRPRELRPGDPPRVARCRAAQRVFHRRRERAEAREEVRGVQTYVERFRPTTRPA